MSNAVLRFVASVGGTTVLDINDQVSYFYLDGSKFPMPKVLHNLVENDRDGARLSSWRFDKNEITVKLAISGTSYSDVDTKARAFFRELLKSNILEWCPWDGASSIFYKTLPCTPDLPDWPIKYIRDAFWYTDITADIVVDPLAWGSLETLTPLENLVTNGQFEDWVAGVPDGWTITISGVGTAITEEVAAQFSGTSCVKFVKANGVDDCFLDSGFIAVDLTKHYVLHGFTRMNSAVTNPAISIRCYTAADAYISDVVFYGTSDDEWSNPAFRNTDQGVIQPYQAPPVAHMFPANTAKVKVRLRENAGDQAATWYTDCVFFAQAEYSADNTVRTPTCLVIPGSEVKGDCPAPAIVTFNPAFGGVMNITTHKIVAFRLAVLSDAAVVNELVQTPTDGDLTAQEDYDATYLTYVQEYSSPLLAEGRAEVEFDLDKVSPGYYFLTVHLASEDPTDILTLQSCIAHKTLGNITDWEDAGLLTPCLGTADYWSEYVTPDRRIAVPTASIPALADKSNLVQKFRIEMTTGGANDINVDCYTLWPTTEGCIYLEDTNWDTVFGCSPLIANGEDELVYVSKDGTFETCAAYPGDKYDGQAAGVLDPENGAVIMVGVISFKDEVPPHYHYFFAPFGVKVQYYPRYLLVGE